MNISFKKFSNEHLPLWERWIEIPHVKDIWFVEGYETSDYMQEKMTGNGYDYSFVIYLNDKPIGYTQCCDLYAYKTKCPIPKGLFTNEKPGTFCIDIFIAEESYLGKGYGTEVVKVFSEKVFKEFKAKMILIDPAASNVRAIKCYEKAGFHFVRKAHDGVTECVVMGKINVKK